MSKDGRTTERVGFLSLVALVQGGLLGIALAVGAFMQTPPWKKCHLSAEAVFLGVVATIPMLVFFAITYRSNISSLARIRRFVQEALGKPLASCNYLELCGVATMAGISEEFVFRGILEPGLSGYSPIVGFIVSNLIFGICHAATPLYAVLATLLGCYLSLTLQFTTDSNLIVPIVSHSLYDLVAFIVVRNLYLSCHSTISQSDGESSAEDKTMDHLDIVIRD